ncbi:MAG: hypothetical protein RR379_11345, partial [Clostridia bacterium]
QAIHPTNTEDCPSSSKAARDSLAEGICRNTAAPFLFTQIITQLFVPYVSKHRNRIIEILS